MRCYIFIYIIIIFVSVLVCGTEGWEQDPHLLHHQVLAEACRTSRSLLQCVNCCCCFNDWCDKASPSSKWQWRLHFFTQMDVDRGDDFNVVMFLGCTDRESMHTMFLSPREVIVFKAATCLSWRLLMLHLKRKSRYFRIFFIFLCITILCKSQL